MEHTGAEAMKPIWADLSKKWNGFRLTRYALDVDKVRALPLAEERRVEGKIEKIATTVGEIYIRFVDSCVEVENGVLEVEITSKTEKASFAGLSFNNKILSEMLKLRKEGFDPFLAQWFFYDSDRSRTDPHEAYSFFVVCDDKIVRECVEFSDYIGSGFDPSVFETDYDSDSSWPGHRAFTEAMIQFWYQKFYTESQVGQLMVLRRDKPKLYGGRSNLFPAMPAILPGNAHKAFSQTHRLLWILIVLVGLILMRLLK
jgi:hypothetical protein